MVPGSDLDFEAPRQVVADGVPSPNQGTSYDTARDGRLIMSNADIGSAPSRAWGLAPGQAAIAGAVIARVRPRRDGE